jgi:hypothetical protein
VEKIQQNRRNSRWQYGARALHAGYIRIQTHTQNTQHLFLFHCDNGCTNAPQCYAMRTLASCI